MKGLAPFPEVIKELVLFSRKIEYPEVHDMGFRIHILERKPKKDPRVFFRFFQICRQFRPDIIHSWGTMPSVYALPAAKTLGIKLINASIADAPANLGFNHPDYLRGRLINPLSDVVVGNSKAGLKAYSAPMEKSYCVYNGFDFNRINQLESKANIKNQLGIKTPKLVAMVGGFFPRKDFGTYIQAACEIIRQRKDVSFLAIGKGPNLKSCQALVQPECQDRILFPGMMKNIESVINIMDIGVLSTNSKVHQEGISNSILEYMVLGKPVVASEGGGTNEIVVDGITGILIKPNDPEALKVALLQLLDRPKLAQKMGENGRKRVRDHFSLPRMIEEYLGIYQGLMRHKNPHQKDKFL